MLRNQTGKYQGRSCDFLDRFARNLTFADQFLNNGGLPADFSKEKSENRGSIRNWGKVKGGLKGL